MLNIPESVKTLFKTDGTHKNFRVQFPNGEYPDITNENIVRESLHFTESLCSQSVFRFGLAEASVLEFETVGIGNMYGMTINASIEIDLSSLSASEIADIEAGTWDGEFVNLSSSDLGFPFFRVPLGVFRIEKCPRNQGAMTHRQVTAYGAGVALDSYVSPFEQWKLDESWGINSFKFNSVDSLIWANLGWTYPSIVDEKFTKAEVPVEYQTSSSREVPVIYLEDYSVITVKMIVTMEAKKVPAGTAGDYLFSVDASGFRGYTALAYIAQVLDLIGHPEVYEQSAGRLYQDVKDWFCIYFRGLGKQYYFSEETTRNGTNVFVNKETPIAVPPKKGDVLSCYVFAPVTQRIQISYRPGQYGEYQNYDSGDLPTSSSGDPFKLYSLEYKSAPLALEYNVASTGKGETGYTFQDAYSLGSILPGWLELSGTFGRSNRSAGFEIVELSPTNRISIGAGDYDEVWWDEYDVSPIGKALVVYKSAKKTEETASVSIGSGSSVYDMTANEMLKNLENATLSKLTTILRGNFKTNSAHAGFTPVDMIMQSWPWMEAGDALKITAEDGTIVKTYALRVEMSGIQHLMATITAEGGEIVGET